MSKTVQQMNSTLDLLKKLKSSSFLFPRKSTQSIPPPSSILPQLLQMGLSPQQSQQLVQLLEQPAALLKHKTEAAMGNIHRILAERAPQQNPQIAATVQRTLQARLLTSIQSMQEEIIDSIYSRLQREQSPSIQLTRSRKPVFKHEFTPLLENLFATNRYPSAQDKAALAGKTGMSVKQIQDWFQNHRNRAKHKGNDMQKLNSRESPPGDPTKDRQFSRSVTPVDSEEDERDEPVTKRPRISKEAPSPLSPDGSTPSHATSHQPAFDFFSLPFDSTLIPKSATQPHSPWQYPAECVQVSRPSSLDWPRLPHTGARQSPRKKEADVTRLEAQLGEDLAFKLCLRDTSRKRQHAELESSSHCTKTKFVPWAYYRTHPAQHPAFILPNQTENGLNQAKARRICKPLPRRLGQRSSSSVPSTRNRCSSTYSTNSVSSVTSSSSSLSRSSSQSSIPTTGYSSPSFPTTPESSPRPYHPTTAFSLSSKAFEPYVGPLIRLNQLLIL